LCVVEVSTTETLINKAANIILNMDIQKTLEKEIAPYFDKIGAHDMTHTKRVLSIGVQIVKREKNADMEVVKAACILHDVARKKEDTGKCKDHAKEGAKIAVKILKKIKFPEKKIRQVEYAIKVHRKSARIKPKTIEAKILQDADRIDIFGAVGIARTFAHLANKMLIHSDKSRKLTYYEDINTDSILEFLRSLLFATPDKFNTKTGWKIVKDRLEFLKKFIKQFEKEWQ
jgi:uncharacterized protein